MPHVHVDLRTFAFAFPISPSLAVGPLGFPLLCCINFHSHSASVSLWASSCIELSARLPSHNLVRIFVAVAWLHLRFLPSSWLASPRGLSALSSCYFMPIHIHIHIVHLYDILKHNIGFSHCPLLLWLSCFFELQGLLCVAATYLRYVLTFNIIKFMIYYGTFSMRRERRQRPFNKFLLPADAPQLHPENADWTVIEGELQYQDGFIDQ